MATEIKDGRGCGSDGDHLMLKLDHLGEDLIESKLPGIREIAKKFADVDPVRDPIPVVPTCHYMMGGIPTNYRGEVVAPTGGNPDAVVPGFFAAGECACASVHGANRLGTNSLTDLLVFGKASGDTMIRFLKENPLHKELPKDAGDLTQARLSRLDGQTNEVESVPSSWEISKMVKTTEGTGRKSPSLTLKKSISIAPVCGVAPSPMAR